MTRNRVFILTVIILALFVFYSLISIQYVFAYRIPKHRKQNSKKSSHGSRSNKVFPSGARVIRYHNLLQNSEHSSEDEDDTPIINRESRIPFLKLPHYPIPEILEKLLEFSLKERERDFDHIEVEALNRVKGLLCEKNSSKLLHNRFTLTKKNYVKRFRLIMWIEEFETYDEVRVARLENCRDASAMPPEDKVDPEEKETPEEDASSISKSNSILFTSNDFLQVYNGSVDFVKGSKIQIKSDETMRCDVRPMKLNLPPLYLELKSNRTVMRMSHKALNDLNDNEIEALMFPEEYELNPREVKLRPFFNPKIRGNMEQTRAIKNIVENRAFPAPYIIFGPPGTGKTDTMVEAITQIWSIYKNFRVCVCASSNSAADVIACRLLKYIPRQDIIRVYANSRNTTFIPPKLKRCSNYDSKVDEVFFPAVDELKKKKVVIMTATTAGKFVRSYFCFDYLFIDEVGHMIEVEALIPIVGFLKKDVGEIKSCSLVLAGDYQQLEPVVISPAAKALGYGMSLLERLMSQCSLYQKDPITSKYNSKVITKLVNNYRSHEKILRIPNQLIYHGELVAMAPKDKVNSLCKWEKLPTPYFPIIFHSVKGTERQDNDSYSFFNTEEIDVLVQYIEDLTDSVHEIAEREFGILSPYRKQVEKIRERLSTFWPNIVVGSVEEFQGQERKVIIISTVRSRLEFSPTEYRFALGFLKNKKRFNVAITRAEALLIVIGNPDVLQCDPYWRVFINYCMENKAFIGEPANGTVPDDFNPHKELIVELKEFQNLTQSTIGPPVLGD